MPFYQVVSIGYEGRNIGEFISALQYHGVKKLVDVREKPFSRRAGFSKRRLEAELNDAGIDYMHLRRAGNPHHKNGASIEHCLGLYRRYLEANPEVIRLAGAELSESPVAFLCYERCHDCCHRSVLLENMESLGYNFEVVRVE